MARARKLTITVDEDVYDGLHRVVKRGNISRFISDLARPHVVHTDLEAGYRAMLADTHREQEADDWIEGVVGDVTEPLSEK